MPLISGTKTQLVQLQNTIDSIVSGGGGIGGVSITFETILTNATLSSWNKLVSAFATSGNITLTLPSTTTIGQSIEVIKMDATENTITIVPSVGTINGLTSVTLYNQYDSITIKSVSNNCFVFSGNEKTTDGGTF